MIKKKKINSDYSEFIPDRFLGKMPHQFFADLPGEVLEDKNRLDEIKQAVKGFQDVYEDGDIDPEIMGIGEVISHYLFYEIFKLQSELNDDRLAPSCLFYEEYGDYEAYTDEVIEKIKDIVYPSEEPSE